MSAKEICRVRMTYVRVVFDFLGRLKCPGDPKYLHHCGQEDGCGSASAQGDLIAKNAITLEEHISRKAQESARSSTEVLGLAQ